MDLPAGEFLYHTVCPSCGSSDALSVYSSGTGYCYSCKKYQADVHGAQEEGRPKVMKQKAKGRDGLLNGTTLPHPKRKLTKETCEKFNYQVGKYNGIGVHIATYRTKGQPTAQHLRTADKEFPWLNYSKNLELFGQHLWPSTGKMIIIAEGEIDAMSISQSLNHKWPVVSVPSGASSAKGHLEFNLSFLEGYDKIILAFDDDKAGHEAIEACVPLFTPGKVRIMTYNGAKDANELLVAGKGGMIMNLAFNAPVYRPDGIISGTELWDYLKESPMPGLPIPYPLLQEKLDGFREGRLFMFTAGSGVGKSTLVNELAYYLFMIHKQGIGVLALEESVKRNAERYLAIYLNQPIHIRRNVSLEKIRAAYDATINTDRFSLYDHWGSTEVDNIIDRIRHMIVVEKAKWIVLDHISIVVSGMDELGESERKTLDKLMTRLRALVQQTGASIMAVVHLKRPQGNGKSYNEGRQVSLTDLRGSAALEQLSDVVISLERNQQDPENKNKSIIRLLKDRDVGDTGEADHLIYNPDTGRLLADVSIIDDPFNRFSNVDKPKILPAAF